MDSCEIEKNYKRIIEEAQEYNSDYWVRTGNNMDELSCLIGLLAKKIYILEDELSRGAEKTNAVSEVNPRLTGKHDF